MFRQGAIMRAVIRSLIPALFLSVLFAQSPDDLLKQAIALHQSGDIEHAIPAYQKYLAQRPDSPMALSNLGAAYARLARYQDAIVQYRHALKLQPGNAPVELNLALAFYKTGQAELAAATLEKVHRAAPGGLGMLDQVLGERTIALHIQLEPNRAGRLPGDVLDSQRRACQFVGGGPRRWGGLPDRIWAACQHVPPDAVDRGVRLLVCRR